MLVCPQPAPLLDAMLNLVGADDNSELPQLPVGLASGTAVSRAGECLGSPVNLATRVTGVPRQGAVLVAESIREAIGEGERFVWSFAGPRRLKGFRSDMKLYRAHRGGKG